jgi:hypothetical protein
MVTAHKGAREATAAELDQHLGGSKTTTLEAMSKLHFSSVQPTFKPGLTEFMRAAHLKF